MQNKKKKYLMICAIIILITLPFLFTLIENNQRSTNKEVQSEEIEYKEEQKIKEDRTPPVLELKTDKLTAQVGTEIDFKAQISKAYDKEDGNLIDEVVWTEIDLNKPGSYEVEYSLSDHAGNTTVKVISLTIKEQNNDSNYSPSK